MARMSRMDKYKDLRESIKTGVVTQDDATLYTKQEEPVRDADYYKRFLASEEAALNKASELKKPQPEDTLMESLTLDTINAQGDEELERALNRVRQESGQEDFNTRMDILNKIRQTQAASETIAEDDQEVESEEEDNEKETGKHRFGFFKRHQDDDEEDEYDDEEYDDDDEDDEDTHRSIFSLFKRSSKDNDEQEDEVDEDPDEEENSTFIKVLNGIIVVLALVLVALIAYIVKEFFF